MANSQTSSASAGVTASALREEILTSSSEARRCISCLFDEGTFFENGTYVKGNEEGYFEGVITGCGAVAGRPVFVFVEDYGNGRGAFTAAHAKKIVTLYDNAMRAGAPVVGIFSSAGAKLSEGIDVLSGYGSVMASMQEAKGLIPQIGVISGPCGGAAAVTAGFCDFLIADQKKGEIYLTSAGCGKESKGIRIDAFAEGVDGLMQKTRELLSYLPLNSDEGTVDEGESEDINTPVPGVADLAGGDVKELIGALVDSGSFCELSSTAAPEMVIGFARMNGRAIGIAANQPTEKDGKLTKKAARKATRLIDFLGRFGIPLLTLVNTTGFEDDLCGCYPTALAELSAAYLRDEAPKVTAVVGKAYGSAFTLMGSKSLGADTVLSLDHAVISVLEPNAAVEMMWADRVKKAKDPAAERVSLADEWCKTAASPLSAARSGDIDDIVADCELKQRIAAAFEVLAW